MTTFFPTLGLTIVLLAATPLVASAQQAVNQLPRPRPPVGPGVPAPKAGGEELKSNYRLTFSGTKGGKPLGELSTLTCAAQIQVSGPLEESETPTTFTVQGVLSEKDGDLLFAYSIGFSLPVTSSTISLNGKDGESRPRTTTIQYHQHSSTGTLRMKPGRTYEVLRSGGMIYTITVSPEEDK